MNNKIRLTGFGDIKYGESIYVSPAGGAANKFVKLLKKQRPDVNVVCLLDSYKSSFSTDVDVDVNRIDEIASKETTHRVIVVIERVVIVNELIRYLKSVGFSDVYWVDNRFSVINEREICNERTQAMRFFYDFSVNALNYEFLISLAHADAERCRRGLCSMHVILVPRNRNSLFDLSRESIRDEEALLESDNYWFMNNVIIPSMALMPSCAGFTLCESRELAASMVSEVCLDIFPDNYCPNYPDELDSVRNCHNKNIYSGKGYGQPFISNKSSLYFIEQWLLNNNISKEKLVVITLRDNKLSKERNSDVSAWKCFAKEIIKEGFFPVFVKDTYTDFESDDLDDYWVFNPSSWNIMLRMALYETAFLNMTVNTGTVALCMFNAKVRYINFVYISDEDYSGSERFHEAAGTPVGSQYPGASKYQKIVWGGGGDCKKIVMEFIDMADLIKSDLPN